MPRGKKTASDTAFIPGKNGGKLLAGGKPGNKGGGRTTNSLKAFLAELRGNPNAHAALQRAALDDTSRNFGNTWRLAADYDEEKPVAVTGLQGDITIKVQFTRE